MEAIIYVPKKLVLEYFMYFKKIVSKISFQKILYMIKKIILESLF